MKPLKRPMFRSGGPIKEGIMHGMQDGGLANNEGPRRAALVGNPIFPRDAQGRSKHLIQFALPFLGTAARMLAPRAIAAAGKAFGRGVMTGAPGTSPFASGITGLQRLRNLLPTGRFLNVATPKMRPGASFQYKPAPLRLSEAIRSPEVIGKAIFIFIVFVISYIFAEYIYNFLVQPYAEAVKDDLGTRRLIFTALHETFITYIKLAFFSSIFLGSPVLLIQIYKFIAPGLYKNEKKALLPYLISTPILFLLGALLVYYLVMPLAIKFFLSFETLGTNTSLPIQLEAKVNEYLSLIMRLIFAFGISFQLPILLNLLARIGVVNSDYLKKRRRYVIVIIFALAAILTPPDPITQVGLAIPLLLLYELSIFTVKFIERKKEKENLDNA